MTKERGYILPEWAFMIEKDTGFMETYNNLYRKVLADGKALPQK